MIGVPSSMLVAEERAGIFAELSGGRERAPKQRLSCAVISFAGT